MIRIFDYNCSECGNTQEEYITAAKTPEFRICKECGAIAKKIISLSGITTNTVDAPWIKLTAAVSDPKSDKSHVKEFRKHPTRANLKTYLKKENLRIGDKAEPNFPVIDREGRREKINKQMIQMHQDRNAVRVGGL